MINKNLLINSEEEHNFPNSKKTQSLSGASGILPDHLIETLIARKKLLSINEIKKEQIQPASLDLRLGKRAYRIRASFIPSEGKSIKECAKDLIDHEFNIEDGVVLERNCVYLVELQEYLDLPDSLWAIANPKSSTGRIDVFTRVIADGTQAFDTIPLGYNGPLYAEISPHKFSIKVREGSRLSQIRFIIKNSTQLETQRSTLSDRDLMKLHDELCKAHNGIGLVEGKANIRDGLQLSISLKSDSDIIGYRAKPYTAPIDVDNINYYKTSDYWDPIIQDSSNRIILDPNEFYILASSESVSIPPDFAAEMVPIDPSMGEFRVHYAGFFDPGFGFSSTGGKGSRAVLEVRSLDVPFYLEHKQIVARLKYEKLAEDSKKLYGKDIGSTYQSQKLKLSKHFYG